MPVVTSFDYGQVWDMDMGTYPRRVMILHVVDLDAPTTPKMEGEDWVYAINLDRPDEYPVEGYCIPWHTWKRVE